MSLFSDTVLIMNETNNLVLLTDTHSMEKQPHTLKVRGGRDHSFCHVNVFLSRRLLGNVISLLTVVFNTWEETGRQCYWTCKTTEWLHFTEQKISQKQKWLIDTSNCSSRCLLSYEQLNETATAWLCLSTLLQFSALHICWILKSIISCPTQTWKLYSSSSTLGFTEVFSKLQLCLFVSAGTTRPYSQTAN